MQPVREALKKDVTAQRAAAAAAPQYQPLDGRVNSLQHGVVAQRAAVQNPPLNNRVQVLQAIPARIILPQHAPVVVNPAGQSSVILKQKDQFGNEKETLLASSAPSRDPYDVYVTRGQVMQPQPSVPAPYIRVETDRFGNKVEKLVTPAQRGNNNPQPVFAQPVGLQPYPRQ
jgi:hypothetical protein